jgi:hypothetical protein
MLQPESQHAGQDAENCMQDVLDHLNAALAALRTTSDVSREDVRAVQKMIAALDVTLRFKASNESATKRHEIILTS